MTSQNNGAGRPRLTVAMIVRDEQEVLAATLESVGAVADEIVVLDTGSKDQTPSLAEQLGAKVRRAAWEDDFSAARNRLLEDVTGDWILWLDAGEQLTPGSAGELRAFLDHQADPRKVYLMMLELPAGEPNGSAEQAARPRLMPAHPELRFAGRICESLQPSMDRLGIALDAAPGRIVRHARCHNAEVKAAKARRDLQLVELETAARGVTPALLNRLGEAHSNLHDPAAARKAFLQAISIATRGSTEMLDAYYGLLTTFEGDSDQQEQQITSGLEALDVFPLDAQLLVAMGGYLQKRQQLELAGRAFDLAIKHGQINVETWHLCEILEIASVCLSVVLQQWLQREPNHPEAHAYLRAIMAQGVQTSTIVDSDRPRQLRIDPVGPTGAKPSRTSVVDCISPADPAPEWAD
jgi:tetratricopeptide (TPR) repeat protein